VYPERVEQFRVSKGLYGRTPGFVFGKSPCLSIKWRREEFITIQYLYWETQKPGEPRLCIQKKLHRGFDKRDKRIRLEARAANQTAVNIRLTEELSGIIGLDGTAVQDAHAVPHRFAEHLLHKKVKGLFEVGKGNVLGNI